MASFLSNGIEIAYEVSGRGPAVVLVHGFASNGATNWVITGWVEALNTAGYMTVVLDNRGHGRSQKLYDPAAYPARVMAGDVARLIDHLDIGPAALLGYSMGARISAFVALDAPGRVAALIFGGLGINMTRGFESTPVIVDALEAASLAEVTNRVGRQFRIFAEYTQSDLKALAACMRSSRDPVSEDDLAHIKVPALVAVGSDDRIGGAPEPLAALLKKGEALSIAGRDHMRATDDKHFKSGVIAFLDRVHGPIRGS